MLQKKALRSSTLDEQKNHQYDIRIGLLPQLNVLNHEICCFAVFFNSGKMINMSNCIRNTEATDKGRWPFLVET